MVKKFNEMLENYAEKVNFPYDPVGSEDTILIFSRHFRFCTEPFDNLIFGHRINILNIDKENPCASVFLEIMNVRLLNGISVYDLKAYCFLDCQEMMNCIMLHWKE